MPTRRGGVGFQPPVRNIRRLMARRIAFAELLMTLGLVVCLAIALTAVSLGMARADTLGAIVDGRDGAWAAATFLALLVAGLGGITAAATTRDAGKRRDG